MSQLERIQDNAAQGVLSYADLMQDATIIDSVALEQDKKLLLGVPMCITRVTYRPKGKVQERGYVSVEATIGDVVSIRQAIRRGWIPNVTTMEDFLYGPEERIVFNDGGTGIRRQLTMLLHATGKLNVGDIVDDGTFDIDWSEWTSFDSVGTQKVNDVEMEIPDFRGLRIGATRGLRVSTYDMDGTDAETFYLS